MQKQYKVGDTILFSEKYSCPVSGFTIQEIEPRIFSFNNPYGACKHCGGIGKEMYFDAELIVPNKKKTIREGAIAPWFGTSDERKYMQILKNLASHYDFSLDDPYYELSEDIQNMIICGNSDKKIEVEYEEGNRTYKCEVAFEGVMKDLEKRWGNADKDWIREELSKYQSLTKCNVCNGYRLNEQALAVKIDDKNIGEVCSMSIVDSIEYFKQLPSLLSPSQKQIAEKTIVEILRRLEFLNNVGLGYLTLNRESISISGGESQRIRLASQIGSGLSGVIYVLDEPSIGLHQSDNDKLIETLKGLRDLGNTVIVVEHDEETMTSADYLIDIGPGAGIHGGEIVAKGTPEEVKNNENSITGAYLSGRKEIEIPEKRRNIDSKKQISIRNARTHNLKNIDIDIPLGVFCSVTGVSGGGKSSLIIHTLYKALYKIVNNAQRMPQGYFDSIDGLLNVDKVVQIDQSPIGKTPRSNPATYVGAYTFIRELYLRHPESSIRGYKLGRFSFNVKGGRCEVCQGDGVLKIEMHFLPDVYVKCEACNGKRFNDETLEIKYNGKNISDVLDMTVEEATLFFRKQPNIYEKLKSLNDVGLGYMKLGQSATTLSGGEAQRIKLAKELSKKATGNTVYILDEPTTGLHSDDIKKLLNVLHKLVEQGNTAIVIEHNLDVIKTSDWVIDIGPGGGDKGGHVVAEGIPEDIVNVKESLTGRYLKKILDKHKKK